MSGLVTDLAKAISPSDPIAPVKPAPPHRWTRGVIDTVAAGGAVMVFLDGAATSVPAIAIQPVAVGQTVEVLDASPRLIVHGVPGGNGPVLLHAQVGVLPPAGTPFRPYKDTWTGNVLTAFGICIATIDISGLGIAYGYTATACSGDGNPTGANLYQTPIDDIDSTLTSLVVYCKDPTGTNLVNGTHVRVNYDILCA